MSWYGWAIAAVVLIVWVIAWALGQIEDDYDGE